MRQEQNRDDSQWERLSSERAATFDQEAAVEIGPEHELYDTPMSAVSTCPGCDDALFRLQDGGFAIVHLTWSRKQEPNPWPRSQLLGGFIATELVIDQHAH
jgi:hypothetical protein